MKSNRIAVILTAIVALLLTCALCSPLWIALDSGREIDVVTIGGFFREPDLYLARLSVNTYTPEVELGVNLGYAYGTVNQFFGDRWDGDCSRGVVSSAGYIGGRFDYGVGLLFMVALCPAYRLGGG